MKAPLRVEARALGKTFRLAGLPIHRLMQALRRDQSQAGQFWALRDVNLSVRCGEAVGIVGRNGSGKSTLLHLVCGTLRPSTGTVVAHGRIAAMLELGAGFNPEFTGRENVMIGGLVMGMTESQIRERFADIAAFAEIGEFMERPLKQYSTGMRARLAFAVCAHVDSDILVVDEALAVGDIAFQRKCMHFMAEFRRRGTLLFVSHDSGSITQLCDRAIWLDRGIVRADGSAREVCRDYAAALTADASTDTAPPAPPHQTRATTPGHRRDPRWDGAIRIEISGFDRDAPWHGNGAATIERVQFCRRDGTPLGIALGGEEVELRVAGRALRSVARPIVGFLVRDARGQILFGDNTYATYRAVHLDLRPGDAFAAGFRLQMPYFTAADYTVAVSIIDGTQNDHVHIHWIEEAIRLCVVTSPICTGVVGIPMREIRIDLH